MIHSMSKLTSPPRRPTYADIEALPPGVRGEILAGELVASPRPAGPHRRTASALNGLLFGRFDPSIEGLDGWWIDVEPELSLGVDPDFDPVVPDLGGWRLETLPSFPEPVQIHVAPDWVCEVISPSTARRDRVSKIPFYGRAGVGYAWVVDPVAQSLEVLRLDGAGYRLAMTASGTDVVRAEPFEAFELDLAVLWLRRAPVSTSHDEVAPED